MKKFNLIIFLFMINFLIACSTISTYNNIMEDAKIEDKGKIFDLKTKKQISSKELLGELSKADIVFVGETHNNKKHHLAEEYLAKNIVSYRKQGSFVLEMLQPFQQAFVDKLQSSFQKNKKLESEEIETTLNWSSGWPWHLYKNLVTYLFNQEAKILEANLNKEDITKIYNVLPDLSGKMSTSEKVKDTLRKIIGEISSHQQSIDAMVLIQQFRDRKMAEVLYKAPKPTMLFAGTMHTIKNLGAPLHLLDVNNGKIFITRVVILSTSKEKFDDKKADYVWYLD